MTPAEGPQKQPPKFSVYFYNPVTYAGALLAALVLLVEFYLFALDFMAHGGNLYLGLITYVFLPPFLILGLLLIPAGALWKRRRVAQGRETAEKRTFFIDPSIPSHRNAILVFAFGTFVFVVMTLVGAYKGFHYTESTEFCGVTCHAVMHPEYETHKNSPHSSVKCIDCHVGQGAEWYFRSKMAGTRQLYRVATGTYAKPIKTPVHNLRPATETCEECHSPKKLYSTFDFDRSYFLTEGDDPEWRLRMLLNVGGGEGKNRGVHAHMNVEREIYYAAEDERRQEITWIKSVTPDGKETVYVAPGSKFEAAPPAPGAVRRMDCVDCHNRPTHQFQAPYRLVNEAMQEGKIDASLPGFKEKALSLMGKDYPSREEGARKVAEGLLEHYRKDAAFFEANRTKIEASARLASELYTANVFPEMKVRWDTHPDNIGHLVAPGCFRCHDGEHRSPEGGVITRDCNACHTIIEQGPSSAVEKNVEGLEFRHPADIGDDWKEAACTDCHSGS